MEGKFHLHGWKKDKHDERDYLFYKALPVLQETALPKKIDLSPQCSVIEYQGSVGSCTANAAVGALEYIFRDRLTKKFLWFFKSFQELSRLFVYWNTRDLEGTTDFDSGASIRETIKALAKFGTCYEKHWPYDESAWSKKPTEKCYKEALKFELTGYYRVNNLLEVLNALAQRHPVEFGSTLHKSFESVRGDGMVPVPKAGEITIGGHAMLAVGYDLDRKYILVRNSWGTGWGLGGYCKMPFDYFTFGRDVDDFWVVKE